MADAPGNPVATLERDERFARRLRTTAALVALWLTAALTLLHDVPSFGAAFMMQDTAIPFVRMWARLELFAMLLLAAALIGMFVGRRRWTLLLAVNLPGAASLWLQSLATRIPWVQAPQWNVDPPTILLPPPLTSTLSMLIATLAALGAMNVAAVAWTARRPPPMVSLRARLAPRRWIRTLAVNPLFLPFGPIFSKDVRVLGRRRATYWTRALYPLGLLGIVSLVYVAAMSDAGTAQGAWRIQKLQEVAPALAVAIAWFQFVLLLLIAPVLTGPAICEERRTRTLASLMTTPMTSAQIVFSSFAGRMMQLLILSLVAAPLLLAVRVFGGLEPRAILAFCAITLAAVALMAALGLLFSVWCRRAVTASVAAVLSFALLTIVPMVLLFLVLSRFRGMGGGPPLWIITISAPVSMGVVTSEVMGGGGPRMNIHSLWITNVGYSLAMTVLVLLGATAALRRVMLSDTADAARPVKRRHRRRRAGAALTAGAAPETSDAPAAETTDARSHEVGNRPVLWRELRAPALGSTRNLVLAVCLVAGILLWLYYEMSIGEEALHYGVSVIAVLLLCIQAATGASMAVAGERETQTWQVLLTTPLSGAEILLGKFFGALRKCWVCAAALGVHLVIGIAAGVLRPSVLLHMSLIVLGACVFLTGTGVLWSLLLRTGTRAAAANVGMVVLLWVGVPLVGVMLAEATDGFRKFGLHGPFKAAATVWYASNPICMTVSAIDGATDRYAGADYELFDARLRFVPFTMAVLASCTAGLGVGASAVALASRTFQRISGRSS